MSRNFLDNKILLYQLFLVVRPYYHLQFPVLHDTQYQNHLLKDEEVPFYDEVVVDEIFYTALCFSKRLCSLKYFDWSSCFLWFFCCSVSFYSCPICLLVTPKFFLIHLDSCLLYVFCPFPLLYSAFLHFLLTLTCIFSFFSAGVNGIFTMVFYL